MNPDKDNNKKRKAVTREDENNTDDANGSTDIVAFIEKELGESKLGKPLKRPTKSCAIEIEQLDKALKRLDKLLSARRDAKLHSAASQAVTQQIEYLHQNPAREGGEEHCDDDGCVQVDQDFWMDDLPEAWPVAHGSTKDISQEDAEVYSRLLASVRRLELQRADLVLNTAIREEAVGILRACPDNAASRQDARNWLTEAIDGAFASRKTMRGSTQKAE